MLPIRHQTLGCGCARYWDARLEEGEASLSGRAASRGDIPGVTVTTWAWPLHGHWYTWWWAGEQSLRMYICTYESFPHGMEFFYSFLSAIRLKPWSASNLHKNISVSRDWFSTVCVFFFLWPTSLPIFLSKFTILSLPIHWKLSWKMQKVPDNNVTVTRIMCLTRGLALPPPSAALWYFTLILFPRMRILFNFVWLYYSPTARAGGNRGGTGLN